MKKRPVLRLRETSAGKVIDILDETTRIETIEHIRARLEELTTRPFDPVVSMRLDRVLIKEKGLKIIKRGSTA